MAQCSFIQVYICEFFFRGINHSLTKYNADTAVLHRTFIIYLFIANNMENGKMSCRIILLVCGIPCSNSKKWLFLLYLLQPTKYVFFFTCRLSLGIVFLFLYFMYRLFFLNYQSGVFFHLYSQVSLMRVAYAVSKIFTLIYERK